MLAAFAWLVTAKNFEGCGPGAGEWSVESPEAHGLTSERLARAAETVHEKLAGGSNERYCFLLVKDGVLVKEQYWGNNNKDSRHTTYSVGKTAASLLTGVAVGKGLLDIDAPVQSYGVAPQADFGPYFANVTTRHFLSQTSGEGRFEPGTKYMYDSRTWINHISKTLGKVTGEGVGTWGTKHMTGPMGMPDYWSNQPDDINVGSGGPASCRDLARLGQLILNDGKWPMESRGVLGRKRVRVQQLVDKSYMQELRTPAYPRANYAQGLLTWLNQPVSAEKFKDGLFWERSVCPNLKSEGFPIGDPTNKGTSIGAGQNVVAAMGYLGQYIAVIPDSNMVAVTMGNTQFGWDACPGYDSHLILSTFYESFAPHIGSENSTRH